MNSALLHCHHLAVGTRLFAMVVSVVMTLTALSSSSLAAQDPAKANALFKQAKSKLQAGDREQALDLVSRAASFFAHPAIFLLKSKVLLKLHRYDEAAKVLGRISTRKLPGALKRARSSGLKRAKTEMARRGHLMVQIRPKKATSQVGEQRFTGDVNIWLLPGKHDLKIQAPDHQTVNKRVLIHAGDKSSLSVTLKPAVGTVRLEVSGGLKGVDLKLDGAPLPVTSGMRIGDVISLKIATGEHTISCHRGALVESHSVAVRLNQTTKMSCSQIGGGPSRATLLTVGWGGVAAGLAMAGYGTWGVLSYFSDQEHAKQNGLIADTNKHYGGALYMASGLAIGISSYLLFARDAKTDTALAPTPTSGTWTAKVQ
ncbi:MAG: hypothetical protein KC502_03565 [Myxococcales bacterium]|nr:hypothetical protein [Myxococcales bacterium]